MRKEECHRRVSSEPLVLAVFEADAWSVVQVVGRFFVDKSGNIERQGG